MGLGLLSDPVFSSLSLSVSCSHLVVVWRSAVPLAPSPFSSCILLICLCLYLAALLYIWLYGGVLGSCWWGTLCVLCSDFATAAPPLLLPCCFALSLAFRPCSVSPLGRATAWARQPVPLAGARHLWRASQPLALGRATQPGLGAPASQPPSLGRATQRRLGAPASRPRWGAPPNMAWARQPATLAGARHPTWLGRATQPRSLGRAPQPGVLSGFCEDSVGVLLGAHVGFYRDSVASESSEPSES